MELKWQMWYKRNKTHWDVGWCGRTQDEVELLLPP